MLYFSRLVLELVSFCFISSLVVCLYLKSLLKSLKQKLKLLVPWNLKIHQIQSNLEELAHKLSPSE